MDAFIAQLADKKTAEAGLIGIHEIVTAGDVKTLIEAYNHVDKILEAVGDKQKPVQKAAEELLRVIYGKTAPWAASHTLPLLKKGLDGKSKPAQKEICLEIIEKFATESPKSLAREIEWLVHPIVYLMNDIKASVKSKAKTTMIALCSASGNKDLEPFVPTVVKANESLKNVQGSVEELAGCIFVQNVESPALSVILPVLWRGLNEKSEQTIRRCCVIVDNMCKLVDDPREGAPLLAEIYPLMQKKCDEVSDPEAREMAEKTLATMKKIADFPAKPTCDVKELVCNNGGDTLCWGEDQSEYIQSCATALSNAKCVDIGEWSETMGAWIKMNVLMKIQSAMASLGQIEEEEFVDDDVDSPDLYKGSFSLAYGTLTLLRDTKLHLKKNKLYGLLGPNNCGKTTLMRAISREQVEGFPKRDELQTIFVEHEVEERELLPPGSVDENGKRWDLGKFNIDLSGIEFVVDTCNNLYKCPRVITPELVEQTLGEIGFKNSITGVNPKAAANMCNPITTYSGGWKVKMQLACAKLIEADILMLDEPTGHLDVKNIIWMKQWLADFPGSIITTSANSEFLNECCTHIVDFHERKLRQFKGDKGKVLTQYVEKNPEKASYFVLSNQNQKFNFPAPGPLEGVKSKGRAILKMTGVAFRYPTHTVPTVQDICLQICMLSRVGVVGPNGAGKSTAIKLLIGELKQEVGTVFRHSGMRMAYVAQHAFHHLERHMDKTPVQYILWRFAGNDDRESLENQTKEINVDEEALRKIKWCVDSKSGTVRKCVIGEKGDVPINPDCILNRRKNKQKKYEYEVKMMHKPIEAAVWIERDTMCAMGFEKLVCREDEKQAAAAGLMSKPLTAPSVEKALKDFGLDAESASHSPINALSGGQKVKVVLAAAMWQNPHVLILDEPTNYLDRDGLGALSLGLKDFGGGVVIISHNMEFTNSICTEKWIMEAGRLSREGEVTGEDVALTNDDGGADEIVDGAGNVIKINKEKTMSEKDMKKKLKDLEKRLKEHKKKNTMSDGEMWEVQDKIAELKGQLGMDK
jgi:elongation factor 3